MSSHEHEDKKTHSRIISATLIVETYREIKKDIFSANTPSQEGNMTNLHQEDKDDSGTTSSSSETNKDVTKIVSATDTKQVNQVKFLFFLMLLVSILGAVLVYCYMARLEQDQFEENFYFNADKIMLSIGSAIAQALGGLDSLALTIVDIARKTNQTFPFVTIPDLGVHVLKSLPMTGILITGFSPVLSYENRREWEKYAAHNESNLQSYVNATLRLQDKWTNFHGPMPQPTTWVPADVIHSDTGDIPYDTPRDGHLNLHVPEWHRFPLAMQTYGPANWDWYSIVHPNGITSALTNKKAAIARPMMVPSPDNPAEIAEAELWCEYFSDFLAPDENCMEPVGHWYYPILDTMYEPSVSEAEDYPEAYDVKAMFVGEFYWRGYLKNILPSSSKGLMLVFSNTCTEKKFTYQIDGPKAIYLGVGDYHDKKYNSMVVTNSIFELVNSTREAKDSAFTGLPLDNDSCTFTFHVYPSETLENQYKTNSGIIFAVAAVLLITLPFFIFILYDRKVAKQRQKIVSTATRSEAIISSLFPSAVRDELYPTEGDVDGKGDSKIKGPPIAKLYPDTTVLFADIADFTCWASVRDPFQVFTLLEGVYGAFDKVAKRRNIFKVETVGDSYIAVAGLPDPRFDHAVAMVKFANDIIHEMAKKVVELELMLGPGTSSLAIRVGLNSGPTTAGVLRGAKGRFQIFGDTVNTAARMESNSVRGRIMCTEETAQLLIAAGKEHWIKPREDLVEAKGKGMMQCYWCNPVVSTGSVQGSDTGTGITDNSDITNPQEEVLCSQRLVDWMSDMLERMLKEVISSRAETTQSEVAAPTMDISTLSFASPRDEVTEIISLQSKGSSPSSYVMKLDPCVKSQLNEYIALIASLYNKNPFHNFEHACHVVMASQKILSRVVKPEEGSTTSDTAYGISSDPLTQFAIVFSALIHDVDHPGVSNLQLVKEQTPVAVMYDNKSVAEQNSVTIAWELLFQPQFSELCLAIMPNAFECKHFRQLVVNCVLATDLFDKDLKTLRESRWTKAFDSSNDSNVDANIHLSHEDSIRRATIVIEHVIQAADVSHTMQHWQIYQKWNQSLLREMYNAYVSGRADKDPSSGWYDGELWFFDNYIIPLAKKLKTCGVFGVSCDELLDYAIRNRAEWAAKGRGIVAETIEVLRQQQGDNGGNSNRKLVVNALSEIISRAA